MAIKELAALLGLKQGIKKINVSYGSVPSNDNEIVMHTRSMLQIMVEMATQVEIPQSHTDEGRAAKTLTDNRNEEASKKLIVIRNDTKEPEDAFTSVRYRDYWFWIDDRDFESKRTFSFLMILFSLMETGHQESKPLVTIPAS